MVQAFCPPVNKSTLDVLDMSRLRNICLSELFKLVSIVVWLQRFGEFKQKAIPDLCGMSKQRNQMGNPPDLTQGIVR